MQNVRLRWMSFNELEEVNENQLVPRSLIIEASMSRLMNFECTQQEIEEKYLDIPLR